MPSSCMISASFASKTLDFAHPPYLQSPPVVGSGLCAKEICLHLIVVTYAAAGHLYLRVCFISVSVLWSHILRLWLKFRFHPDVWSELKLN